MSDKRSPSEAETITAIAFEIDAVQRGGNIHTLAEAAPKAGSRRACPELLLWGIARAFTAAVDGDADPASRLIYGLSGLLSAAENYMPGEQPEAAAAMAEAIVRAAPLMAEQSAAKAILTNAGSRAAVSLSITFGQPFAEVRALMAIGLFDEWADLTGIQRAEIETAWRAGRLARRYAAQQGSAALDLSGPMSGAARH